MFSSPLSHFLALHIVLQEKKIENYTSGANITQQENNNDHVENGSLKEGQNMIFLMMLRISISPQSKVNFLESWEKTSF